MAAPLTNSSMNPTFSKPMGPFPYTSQNSSSEAAISPRTAAMMNAPTMRRGDSDALPSWSRYQVMAVTGTRKLPSSTMVGRRMMFPVRYMAPRAAAQRASPISSTAHQRGAHACPLTFFSARVLACRLFTIDLLTSDVWFFVVVDRRHDRFRHAGGLLGMVPVGTAFEAAYLDAAWSHLLGERRRESFDRKPARRDRQNIDDVAATHALHERKHGARDIDQSEDVGIEQLPGGVDEHVDAAEAIAGLRNRALHLLASSHVELDDQGLRRVALDQFAHALRPAGGDDRPLAPSQHRLREPAPDAIRRSGDEPNPLVARRPTALRHLTTDFRGRSWTKRRSSAAWRADICGGPHIPHLGEIELRRGPTAPLWCCTTHEEALP